MMTKVLDYFGTDGLLHMLCSAVLVSVLDWFAPLWLAALLALLIGMGKEIIYDKLMKRGTPQWKDLVADLVGIAIGCL